MSATAPAASSKLVPSPATQSIDRGISPEILAAGQRLAVFLPNYNHARYLPQALDALLAQTVLPREICVLDDASTDNSREIIADYATRFPLIRPVYLSENRGVARNVADWLAQETDTFVFFAAADDVVMPDLLEQSLALLNAYPAAGLCSARSRLMDAEGNDLGLFDTPRPLVSPGYIPPDRASGFLMVHDSWFYGGTTIYRRAALVEAGGFNEELGGFGDGFVSRAIALVHGACFIPRELGYWRRLKTGMAAQTTGSAENARRVADRAETLMSGLHVAPFPSGYAARWRRRWMFGSACTLIDGRSAAERRNNLLALFSKSTAVERWALNALAVLPAPLIRMLLFAVMRPRDILPTVRRKFFGP